MTYALSEAVKLAADISQMANSNLFVNGFHAVNQEYAQGTGVTSNKYPADQWVITSPTSGFYANQVANPFPSQPDIPLGIRMTAPATGALGANDNILIFQAIEGSNLAKLQYGAANARPVTLMFMLRPTFSGVVGFSLVNYANSSALRSFVKRLAVVANQDNFFCFTIPGDVAAALLTTNAGTLQARWCFGSGSNFLTANLDTWTTANLLAPTDVTNMAAVANQAVNIGACVMVAGRFQLSQDALPLLQRRYDDELRLCMRYFYKVGGTVYPPDFGKGAYGILNFYYKTSMRVAASINTDLAVPSGAASGSYGNYMFNNTEGFGLRTDTSGTNSYAQVNSYITANARMT